MKKCDYELTWERRMLFNINSFSRASAPKSEDARGSEKSSMERIGFGITLNERHSIRTLKKKKKKKKQHVM